MNQSDVTQAENLQTLAGDTGDSIITEPQVVDYMGNDKLSELSIASDLNSPYNSSGVFGSTIESESNSFGLPFGPKPIPIHSLPPKASFKFSRPNIILLKPYSFEIVYLSLYHFS